MSVIDHLDPATKRIYLAAGCREYHPVEDLYAEVRTLRRTDEELRKYQCPVTAAGNVPKGGGKYTPRYIIMQHGWRIVPEDTSHVLTVTGEQLTAEGGAGSACMDLTPLSPSSKVVIQYEPPAAEIIYVSGGGGLTKDDVADAVWIESPLGAQVVADSGLASIRAADAASAAASAQAEAALARKARTNRETLTEGAANNWTLYDDDDVTPLRTHSVTDKDGNAIVLQPGMPARRSKGV